MLLPGIFARHTVPAIGVSPAVLKRADGLLATPRRYRTAFVVRCKSSSTQDSSRAQRPHKRTGKQSTGPAGPRQRASSLQDTSPQQSRKPGYKQRHEQHDHSKCTRGRESSSPQQFRTGQHKVLSPPLLTRLIKQSARPDQLLELVHQHGSQLNYIHSSAAITQLGQWKKDRQLEASDTQAVEQLLHALEQLLLTSDHIQQCGPRELSNIIWSCSLLRYTSTPLYSRCLQNFTNRLQQVDHIQQLSIVLYGLAQSGQAISQDRFDHMMAVAATADLLRTAAPQSISNIIWSAAELEHQITEQQLQQLLACFIGKLAEAKPQEVSNTLWAVATMQQSIPQQHLQQMLACLISKAAAVKPQGVSNTIWAVARMQQGIPQQQLQPLVSCFLRQIEDDAEPQHISNTLWGLAKMNAIVSLQQLQTMEVAFIRRVTSATAQNVCNALWAYGALRYFPQQLLAALQDQRLWQTLLPVMGPRSLTQVAVALAALGHRDEQLMTAVLQQAVDCIQHQQPHAEGDTCAVIRSASITSSMIQLVCNLGWSMAVLDMQMQIPEAFTLLQFYADQFESCDPDLLRQLQQVHLWLLDTQPAVAAGLSSVLSEEQLSRCEAVWRDQVQQHATQDHSDLQKEVFRILQQLPLTWRTPPAIEQLCEPDGMFSIDISGVTADGVRLAIEADGPTHFRRPDDKPTGTTLYRNRALAARGYVVISVPYHEWGQPRGYSSKQQYLVCRVQQQLALHKKQTQHDKQPSPSQIMIAPVVNDHVMRRRTTHRTQVQQQQQLLKQQQTQQQQQQQLKQQKTQQQQHSSSSSNSRQSSSRRSLYL